MDCSENSRRLQQVEQSAQSDVRQPPCFSIFFWEKKILGTSWDPKTPHLRAEPQGGYAKTGDPICTRGTWSVHRCLAPCVPPAARVPMGMVHFEPIELGFI